MIRSQRSMERGLSRKCKKCNFSAYLWWRTSPGRPWQRIRASPSRSRPTRQLLNFRKWCRLCSFGTRGISDTQMHLYDNQIKPCTFTMEIRLHDRTDGIQIRRSFSGLSMYICPHMSTKCITWSLYTVHKRRPEVRSNSFSLKYTIVDLNGLTINNAN